MPVHPKFFICSTCFNRVGIDNIKTTYMKCDECGTLKKKNQFKKELSYLYISECIDFLYKENTLSYSVTNVVIGSCVSMSVGHSPHSKKRCLYPYLFNVSACLALSGLVFTRIFVSIFIFCLSGRDLLVSYSMYCILY
jgi:hypothetical protein